MYRQQPVRLTHEWLCTQWPLSSWLLCLTDLYKPCWSSWVHKPWRWGLWCSRGWTLQTTGARWANRNIVSCPSTNQRSPSSPCVARSHHPSSHHHQPTTSCHHKPSHRICCSCEQSICSDVGKKGPVARMEPVLNPLYDSSVMSPKRCAAALPGHRFVSPLAIASHELTGAGCTAGLCRNHPNSSIRTARTSTCRAAQRAPLGGSRAAGGHAFGAHHGCWCWALQCSCVLKLSGESY